MGVIACVALTGSACGAGDGDRSNAATRTAPIVGHGLPPKVDHPVTEAIDDLQRAFASKDYTALCAGVTQAAAKQAGTAGHGTPTTCRRNVRRLFRMIEKGNGWRHVGAPRVTSVKVDGRAAMATVALDERWQARIPLAREAGRWRLSGLFGASPRQARQTMADIADADFPPAGGEPVRVVDGEGRPCPVLSETKFPSVSGGCRIDLSSAIMPLTILTPFGDFQFSRCSFDYHVHVDATGRTWNTDFQVNGDTKSAACGDVNECYDLQAMALIPWRGRIVPDGNGQYLHRVDMCLATCVGNFIGELVVRLSHDDRGWRGEPVDGSGNSGFRFDGPLAVKGRFDIQPD
jgi:hypothetical protein